MAGSSGEKEPAEDIRADVLSTPIPNLSMARATKEGYRNYPIDKDSALYDEELVNIADFDLAGQAYYSRPNAATVEPITEVPKNLYLRKTLAEKLADINQLLNSPALSKFFSGPVELYIEDAHRSYELQKKLYEQIFPYLIWQQNPGITDEQLEDRLRELIANPIKDEDHPSPHATGGAVDVILRFKQSTPKYVKGAEVPMGHADGDTSKRVYLDYFELRQPQSDEDRLAQRNRRAFYAIMRGGAFGTDTELQVNPTEFFHWSYGDQMWAKLKNKPAALYGLAGT